MTSSPGRKGNDGVAAQSRRGVGHSTERWAMVGKSTGQRPAGLRLREDPAGGEGEAGGPSAAVADGRLSAGSPHAGGALRPLAGDGKHPMEALHGPQLRLL